MEIKVKCVCGSLYSFQDNPVDGRLQFPVTCANCGADGTDKAHAYIAAKLSGGPDPTQSAKKGFSGLFKKKDAEDALDETISMPTKKEALPDPDDGTSAGRLALGTFGALAIGAAGAIGWLYLAKATRFEFGYVAWALGGIVGLTARLLVPRGHHRLGLIGATAALLAIGGGELLTAKWLVDEQVALFLPLASADAVSFAKDAAHAGDDFDLRPAVAHFKLATLVGGTDPAGALATYRRYQLNHSFFVIGQIIERDQPLVVFAKQAEASDPESVAPVELAQFKRKVLPELAAFVAGKPSQQEYESALRQMLTSRITFKSVVLASMGPFSWIWVALGIATAYKVAHKEESIV